jgi:FkbM family methyltransferase
VDYRVSYAQNREDIILSGFFNMDKPGFYVDVGAGDPNIDSVTKYFYQRGWHGINIEPIKSSYEKLVNDRKRDMNLNVGVAQGGSKILFREYPKAPGLSTFSRQLQKAHETEAADLTKEHKEYEVETQTLASIFEQHTVKKISFLKIDAEGYEYEVIASNDWKKYRPQVLCVEANHIVKDWRPLLSACDYQFVFSDGLNEYFIDKTLKNLQGVFSYVGTLLGGSPIISAEIARRLEEQSRELNRQKTELERVRQTNDSSNHEIQRLNFELEELRRVLPLLKRLFKSIDAAARRRIERLNRRKSTSVIHDFELNPNATDESKLLRDIRAYDMETYYTRTPSKPRLSYRFVLATYEVFYGLFFVVGKKTYKLLKRILRR